MLSQKQDDEHYHPVVFGNHSLTPSEKNYHSSKFKFLALKWSVTEYFKEYITYTTFVVRTDNNPLTYVLTTPNLNATGHRCVGTLASFEFTLEYQKEADNGVADALSHIPICHNHKMVWSLLEGAIVGAADRGWLRQVRSFWVSMSTWGMRQDGTHAYHGLGGRPRKQTPCWPPAGGGSILAGIHHS